MAVNNNTDTKANPLETADGNQPETDCKYGNETK